MALYTTVAVLQKPNKDRYELRKHNSHWSMCRTHEKGIPISEIPQYAPMVTDRVHAGAEKYVRFLWEQLKDRA